jgi:uncharacterized protein
MPHFLQPLLRPAPPAYGLWNERSGRWLAERVLAAFDSSSRRQGLLGRSGLDSGTALVLAPCWAVHTAFMRFPIDLAFVGKDGRIRRLSTSVHPWRIRAFPGAFAVVELAAGALAASQSQSGDPLRLRTIVSPRRDFQGP